MPEASDTRFGHASGQGLKKDRLSSTFRSTRPVRSALGNKRSLNQPVLCIKTASLSRVLKAC